MNTDFIKGVIVPILTPIDDEEKIDEQKLRSQVDYVIEGGVLGILAFGSNGEKIDHWKQQYPSFERYCSIFLNILQL